MSKFDFKNIFLPLLLLMLSINVLVDSINEDGVLLPSLVPVKFMLLLPTSCCRYLISDDNAPEFLSPISSKIYLIVRLLLVGGSESMLLLEEDN